MSIKGEAEIIQTLPHFLLKLHLSQEWKLQGNCSGQDPHDWDTSINMTPQSPRVRRAKGLCVSCPVRLPCLEQGLKEAEGIWGGALPSERRGKKDARVLLQTLTAQADELRLRRTA